jgi:hypothetical protein
MSLFQVRHSPRLLRADGREHVLRLVPRQGRQGQGFRRSGQQPAQDLPRQEGRNTGVNVKKRFVFFLAEALDKWLDCQPRPIEPT